MLSLITVPKLLSSGRIGHAKDAAAAAAGDVGAAGKVKACITGSRSVVGVLVESGGRERERESKSVSITLVQKSAPRQIKQRRGKQ